MAQIASGASATVSLAAGSIIKVPAGNFQAVAMLGPGPQRGQLKTLGLSDGIIGPYSGAQDVYLTSMSGVFQYFVLRADYATSGAPVLLTAAEIASPSTALLADTKATYQLDVAPNTRYQSNGTALVALGGGAGASAFTDLTDKVTADIPGTNTATAGVDKLNNFTKTQTCDLVAIAYAATITIDHDTHGNHINVGALTGNLTLANPTGFTKATTLNVWLTQDGTGSRTLTLDTKFKKGIGMDLTLSTTAAAVDFLSLVYNPTKDIWIASLIKGVA